MKMPEYLKTGVFRIQPCDGRNNTMKFHMNYRLGALLLLLCGSLLASRPARAQEDGQIAIGGDDLFRIYVPVNGRTITQRRESVEDNLVPILSEAQLKPSDIKLTPFGGKPGDPKTQRVRIEVKKHFLINVWPEDGRRNGLTAIGQAKIWAGILAQKLPQLNYRPNPNDGKGQ
jgi:hypothetical protein